MKVLILRGIPGSGKSTLAKGLQNERENRVVFSADSYFTTRDGEYKFDPRQLSAAHDQCMSNYLRYLTHHSIVDALVMVDNTNISAVECAPYVQVASACNVPVIIHTVFCDPTTAWKRNIHGLTEEQVWAKFLQLMNERLPPWWKTINTIAELRAWINPPQLGRSPESG